MRGSFLLPDVRMYFVEIRYYTTVMIHPEILMKYKRIVGNVYGVNDYETGNPLKLQV